MLTELALSVLIQAAPIRSERAIEAEAVVDRPVAEAWEMWTTEEGLSFFAPAALIEPEPGGRYEIWFLPDAPEGMRGSEGTHILAMQDQRLLSITWALPPYMEEVRPHLTHLTIRFEPLNEAQTRVTIRHDGWGEGEAWDAAFAYFEPNWPAILGMMQPAGAADESE
ncbi:MULTISPECIES: SRPBCC family protein [Hyphobacterium]|uniref:SRPBCC domain-containing protein n=1 Tax=Hyphobacterium vulgare TaxID=1736751 RepID=A0ABV6ZW27_9PROT